MNNSYYEYMAEYIADEISCVEDALVLNLYVTEYKFFSEGLDE